MTVASLGWRSGLDATEPQFVLLAFCIKTSPRPKGIVWTWSWYYSWIDGRKQCLENSRPHLLTLDQFHPKTRLKSFGGNHQMGKIMLGNAICKIAILYTCFTELLVRSECNLVVVYSLNWCLLLGFCCDTWECMKQKTSQLPLPISPDGQNRAMQCHSVGSLNCPSGLLATVYFQLMFTAWILLWQDSERSMLAKECKKKLKSRTHTRVWKTNNLWLLSAMCSMFSKKHSVHLFRLKWTGIIWPGLVKLKNLAPRLWTLRVVSCLLVGNHKLGCEQCLQRVDEGSTVVWRLE